MNKIGLKDISDVVNEYVVLLSNVLKIDVEIVDNNMNRIAATGIYENQSGQNIEFSGYVYKEALRSGEPKVIENPGLDILCKNCKDKGKCKECMEICVPIIYGNDKLGVIGLICSTEEQKVRLMENLNTNLEFLKKIADFIAIKIMEEREVLDNKNNLDFLKQIINSVDDGIITISKDHKMTLVSNKALTMLNLTIDVLNKEIKIENTGEYYPRGELFNLKIDRKKYSVVGKIIYNYINFKECEKILIFKEFKSAQKEAVNLTFGKNRISCDEIIGESHPMVQLKSKIKKIASSKSTVLITGDSGTGKELVARAIHAEGDRRNKPFIAINCGAIPESLLESELFGYAKGAFSGANSNGRVGKFELANKGVIFLDEIGDMPLYLQVKLLRVLQERTLVRVGSNKLIDLDIRVVAATNKNLKELVEKGEFREDLYYRLNVIPIEVPPLRKRDDDVILIINKLIKKYNNLFNKDVHTIENEVYRILKEYNWPGNVRELQNVVEFMVNVAGEDGIIKKDMIPKSILDFEKNNVDFEVKNIEENIKFDKNEIKPLKDMEMEYIEKVLNLCGKDTAGKKKAAKMLGIGIATLYRKIESHKE